MQLFIFIQDFFFFETFRQFWSKTQTRKSVEIAGGNGT